MNNLEYNPPSWLNKIKAIEKWLALLAIAYFIVTVFIHFNSSTQHYSIHILFIIALATLRSFILVHTSEFRAWKRNIISILTIITISCAITSFGFFYVFEHHLNDVQPFYDDIDLFMGCLSLVAVLGVTYMVWGLFFFSITLALIPYFLWGHL